MHKTYQYFAECSTVEEIKTLYRKLAMRHHPDRGGDTATMQAINAEYQRALKACHGQSASGTDGKEHVYRYNQAAETEIMDKISEFCGLGMPDVEIMLIGTWVWISGNTKPYKTALKSLGCKWHRRRVCWYWHAPQKWRQRSHPGSLEELAHKYGVHNFDSEEHAQVAA